MLLSIRAIAVSVLAIAAHARTDPRAPIATPQSALTTGTPATHESLPRVRGLSTRDELEAFLDGVMSADLRAKHVAGATVSVVKEGRLFFAKGYGFADVETRAPVDAERTLFRIGSISKLLTWTAVMQLVEQDKLALDVDVNRYIDFEIPATYPTPITLRHVMTHTTGFEDDGRDLFTDDPKRIVPLGRWLATHVPARVRSPGTFAAYSNYASALAGYIVERASGSPWADCIEQRVLEPLGMERTSVRQPLPDRLAAEMSRGYDFDDGRFVAKKFEVITGAAPAGSVSASATDMARFMLAHLGGGELDGRRVLGAQTTAMMHARVFGHDDRLNGSALGFYEKSSHGLRIIGHNGDTVWFHSDLALIPDERVGLFVSYNSRGGSELSRFTFLTEFLDHYYPIDASSVARDTDRSNAAELERVIGEYAPMRRSYTTYQKVEMLAGVAHVEPTDSGTLVFTSSFGTHELMRVGPLLYRDTLGESLVAFRATNGEPATNLFVGDVPPIAFERVRWFESPKLHWLLLGSSIAAFALVLVGAVLRAWRRKFAPPRAADVLPGRAWLVGAALCDLAFVVLFVGLASDDEAMSTSPLIGLKIVLALPVIGTALASIASWSAFAQWRSSAGSRAARLRYAIGVVFALAFAWSLDVWNLLGWRM